MDFFTKIYNKLLCPHQEDLDDKFEELEQAIDDIIIEHSKTEAIINEITKRKEKMARANARQRPTETVSGGH